MAARDQARMGPRDPHGSGCGRSRDRHVVEPRIAGQRKANLEVVASAISATDPFDPGYRLLRRIFDRAEIASLTPILAGIPSSAAGRRWAGPELAALLQSPPMKMIRLRLAELLPGMAVLRAV